MSEELHELQEHAEHAKHDPSLAPATLTMAIFAVLVATVSLLGHRTSTEEVVLQNRVTDQWGYYQAKNNRSSQLEASLALLSELEKAPGADAKSDETAKTWTDEIRKYRDTELPALKIKAEALVKKAHELEYESEGKIAESYQAHRRGDRLDLAELAVELALVLCSIAVLTKQPSFWYAGICSGVVGALIAISAYV